MEHTVKSLATTHGLSATVLRAISFHPQLQAAEQAIWAIPVNYSSNLTTSAGYYHSRPARISLHPALVGNKVQPQDHIETFLHELAHAFQFIVYGRVNHDATWWEMMHQLGQKPHRTHNITACRAAQPGTLQSLTELGL